MKAAEPAAAVPGARGGAWGKPPPAAGNGGGAEPEPRGNGGAGSADFGGRLGGVRARGPPRGSAGRG